MNKLLYITGIRGVPAEYGGFETFAEKLGLYLVDKGWDVTIYCQNSELRAEIREDIWNGVRRVHIAPILKGALGTGIFDFRSFLHMRTQPKGLVLTLGYNTALFNLIPRLNGQKQLINMDGIEWERAKWSWLYKKIFKFNYQCAGRIADMLIADHPVIREMLMHDFPGKEVVMLPYGAPAITQANDDILGFYRLTPKKFMTLVARPEPENSILPIVETWSRKSRNMKLVVLGNYKGETEYQRRVRAVASDEVVFPGAIYRPEVINAIRFYSLAHIHGHTVGGTNPSLVEALGAGNPIIAIDNSFNRWVAGDAALYFDSYNQLDYLLDNGPRNERQMEQLSLNASARHAKEFQWPTILGQYEVVLNHFMSVKE